MQQNDKYGGSKTPTVSKKKVFTTENRFIPSLKNTNFSKPIHDKIDVKLMWFIHGAEKEHTDVPAFSESSISHKKKIPKTIFGPCNFDSLSFFSPGGHYATLSAGVAINIGTLMCKNQTEGKFEKIPDHNGNVELRDMTFSVEPQTDPDAFKQGMSVYLCVKGNVIKIYDYKDLIQFGVFDMAQFISKSNEIMQTLGYEYRKWDLLLCCCRVYQPNIIMLEDGVQFNKYAPKYDVTPAVQKPNRLSASSIEKMLGIPKQRIKQLQLQSRISAIRKSKTTRGESAKKSVRLTTIQGNATRTSRDKHTTRRRSVTTTHGGKPRFEIRQVTENTFYKSLSPILCNGNKRICIK